MIQRILNSKNFVACLAAITGMALYFELPFPAENVFLQLMALRALLVLLLVPAFEFGIPEENFREGRFTT